MSMSAALDATRRLDWGTTTGRRYGRCERWLCRTFGESIDMVKRRHGYFPKVFVWRERIYDVHVVERCWIVSRRALWRKVERLCFRVQARARSGLETGQETFEVYQDLRDSSWHLLRRKV